MSLIILELINKVCILTINRPDQYNALNEDVLKELDENIQCIENEKNCLAVILTGAGEKAFIAGADIKAMSQMDNRSAQTFSKLGQDLALRIERLHVPVIAAVNGYALGGGNEFAMACHIRYASDNAIFGQPEVSLGLIAGFGGTQRLPRLIGKGNAMEILLSGKNITANEALSMGLVNKVFPLKELMPAAKKLALTISKNAPLAIERTLQAVNEGMEIDLISGLKKEQAAFSNLFDSSDTCEGLSAFVEKRTPDFKGK
jgi:enoyl-CoA hydratase